MIRYFSEDTSFTPKRKRLISKWLGEVAAGRGYVMGEHGDSEFVPWSQLHVSTKPVLDIIAESKGKYCVEDLEKIEVDVRTAAYKIIEAKKATYYGIGIALNRLTKSILGDENSVQTVSAYLRGEYGQTGIFIGVPAIINAQGVQSVLECHLTADEQERFDASCNTLREYFVH